MANRKRIAHHFFDAVHGANGGFDRVYVPALLMLGVLYAGYRALERDWLAVAVTAAGVALLVALSTNRRLQAHLFGGRINRRHATYLLFAWAYAAAGLHVASALAAASPAGKSSGAFFSLLIGLVALGLMLARAFAMLTPPGYRFFSTRIPLWEQAMIAVNELVAAALLATTFGAVLPPLLQPDLITVRLDPWYTLGLAVVVGLYYAGMQLMWIQRVNDWLSRGAVWVRLARLLAPLALVVCSMVIARRFVDRADPRSADLLGDPAVDLAVLSLGAVVWLVLLVITVLVFTSGRGLRQRFLPDLLLDRLPPPLARGLRTISDVDLLLILMLLSTVIPAYLFLLDDRGGILGAISGQILARGSGFLETSQQALALLFAIPFYGVIVALMALYAYAMSRPSLPAAERDELVASLPVGFLIVLAITLYLFAVPVSQVLTERRLPQIPLDLGRVLAFNVLIPLVLLYTHYFLLVRWPYGRGQSLWRERQGTRLARQLHDTDSRIETLNRELEQLDRAWHAPAPDRADQGERVEVLFRYVQLNSLRDDLNMQRLQIVSARQQLAEVSEAPVSVAVARLPLRIVSLGIPLLIAIQLYQWAFLNNGLREIINTPNLTVDQFFRIILEQANF